jgi:hypothetical protein
MRELYVALAAHGRAHVAGARERLDALLGRVCPGARARVVVVDNALGGELEIELDRDVTCVSGDNRAREFSAWDRGLAWLERAYAPAPDALVVIANDTLHRHYGAAWLDGFTRARLDEARSAGGLYGWLDAYPREVELFGLRVRRWVRTNLFFAEARTLARLAPLALPFADDAVFAGEAALFREPSPLAAHYRAYLRTWMFGEPGEPGEPDFAEVWHSAQPAGTLPLADTRAKIRSILCEHHLSARARALGIPLVDARAR